MARLSLNASLEDRIADAKANPKPVDAGLPDALSCAALMLENGCEPMPYYAQDVRTAVEFIRQHLGDPGIPIHPTSLASPGIKGVAYIPEVDEILSRQTSDSKPSGYGPHGSNEGGE